MKISYLTSTIVAMFALAVAPCFAQGPTAGDTGTLVLHTPNSEDGAEAEIWGFYKDTNADWVSTTYGTGIVSSGSATVHYTVPSDFASSMYWNPYVDYSPSRTEKTQLADTSPGGWAWFHNTDPNGQELTVKTYMFDNTSVTATSASFRASAQGGTVFPDENLAIGSLEVLEPWTGSLDDYTDPAGTDNYYDHDKSGLLPSVVADRGFTIAFIEGDEEGFQKIRLHNADDSYSVELFCQKVASTEDPLGYAYWATLTPAASVECTYDPASGVFSGSLDTPLEPDGIYFVDPSVQEYVGSLDSDVYNRMYPFGRTELLLSGTTLPAAVPEPTTLGLLAFGLLAALWRPRRRRGR